MISLLCAAIAFTVGTPPWPQLRDQLTTSLGEIVRNKSKYWNDSSIIVTFKNDQGVVKVSAGYRDIEELVESDVNDGLLVGSATKMITAGGILQLVESGAFTLDEMISPLINPYLEKYNSTSLEELFGPNITDVSVRQILSMRSGIPEYDNDALRKWQTDNPTVDLSPFDILHECPKEFACLPGECGFYSSTNYILAGLILAHFSDDVQWDELDQRSVLPVSQSSPYSRTEFCEHGPLSGFNTDKLNVSHGYQPDGSDVWNMSATSGWTCGNMLASCEDLATFSSDYFGKFKVISKSTMWGDVLKFQMVPNLGCYYGLGVMIIGYSNTTGLWVGHGGSTYGFYSMSGYNMNLNFSLAIVTNFEEKPWQENLRDIDTAVYQAVLQAIMGDSYVDDVVFPDIYL